MLFHKIVPQEIQEKNDEDKASNPRFLIIFVGRIVQKVILDI